MNYRGKIEKTKAFKNIEGFKKNIYSSASVMKRMGEQYVQAKNMGYDEWFATYKPNVVENEIIKELLNIKL